MIADRLGNKGNILSTDIEEDRLELIHENCERMGVTCVKTALAEKGQAFMHVYAYVCCVCVCMLLCEYNHLVLTVNAWA